jgi:hypothetical protein
MLRTESVFQSMDSVVLPSYHEELVASMEKEKGTGCFPLRRDIPSGLARGGSEIRRQVDSMFQMEIVSD